MNPGNQVLASVEAAQKAFLESLAVASNSGVSIEQFGRDFALLCQRLSQLTAFCERNPKLPAHYLLTLYHACWVHVKASSRSAKPKQRMRRDTKEELTAKIAEHLFAGGKVATVREAAKISGITHTTLYHYYPNLQHLILVVMDEMMER